VRVVDNVKEMETSYKEKIKKVKQESRVNQTQVNKDLREVKSKLEKLQANMASHNKVKDSNNA